MRMDNLKIFNLLSNRSKELFNENCVLTSFKLGQPVALPNIIPNCINIIIEGEARLLYKNDQFIESAGKLTQGSIIGLSSLLRANASEYITASSELKTIQIPDNIIVKLYNEDKGFKDFCNESIFPSEIISLAKNLIRKEKKEDKLFSVIFKKFLESTKLLNCQNRSAVELIDNYTHFLASENVIDNQLYTIINDQKPINIRPPFDARILAIPNNLVDQFFHANSNQNKEIKDPNTSFTSNYQPFRGIEKSSLEVGQYSPKKEFKFIKGEGILQETVAVIQMLSNEFNIPFRKDSIEKFIRDEIKKVQKPSLDFCGSVLASMGLHISKGEINSSFFTRLPVPTLIKWNESFAIIKQSDSSGISLISPSQGLIKLQTDELKEKFGETLSFLFIERTSRTPNKKFNINWFIPLLVRYKGVLTQVFIASFFVQLFGLANPLLIQIIIDKVISQRSLDTLQVLGIALVFVTILGGLLGTLRTYLFTETTNRIDTKLGSEVIDHLLRLPLNYFDKRPVGELGTRVQELEKIRNFLTGQALTTILDTAFSVIYIIVMVLYSWLLTFIALGVLPIQIALTLLGSPLLRRQIRESARENAKTQSHLVEVLTGVQTVKAQNVETVSRWKWQDLYGKYIARTFEKTITVTALQQTSQVLQQLSQLLVLWVGATLVLSGKMSLGQLIAFRIISGYVTQPLLRLSSIWQSIQELKVSFERLADIIDTPEESNDSDKANILIPSIKGNVEFENVNFTFNPKVPAILKNINLKIKQGEFVGIAGLSGSGKSTLMKLIPRLYEIQEGKIKIDGYDINKVELYSLRKQIGIVPQDPLLFSGSISENISLTNPEIGSKEIVKAAKLACAHEFIMDLPQGYSTNVGERGSSLSGGQKQRIAIARTLLSKPKMLILDEATSALDYDTERRVCNQLKSECKGLTVFFITHRLTTIQNADTIILMNEGVIAEKGNHDQLLEKRGRYFALYKQQEGSE